MFPDNEQPQRGGRQIVGVAKKGFGRGVGLVDVSFLVERHVAQWRALEQGFAILVGALQPLLGETQLIVLHLQFNLMHVEFVQQLPDVAVLEAWQTPLKCFQ